MKNKIISVFYFFAFLPCIFANEDKIFSISLEPLIGLRNGTLIESVFELSGNEYKKLSQLNWQHSNNLFLGGDIDLSLFNLDLSFFGAGFIPKRSGVMDDSDWVDLNNVKNIYSISENYLLNSCFFGVDIGYHFDIKNWFLISPVFSFEYNLTSFEAKNGYGWYASSDFSATGKNESWDSEHAVFYPKGKLAGVIYRRMSLETWIGVSTEFIPIKQLSIELFSYVNPVIYMESFDHHLKKGYYADIAYNIFQSFKEKIIITGHINKSLSVSMNSTFKYIHETQGGSYISNDGITYDILKNIKSGSGGIIFDISLSVSYKF